MRVGLTGGVASGKSTVGAILRDLGAVVVDADRLAREVVEPGTPGLAAVVEAFGAGVVGPDGALDRPALAAVVFADPQARARLDGIVHPLVRARAAELVAAAPAGARARRPARPRWAAREPPSWSRPRPRAPSSSTTSRCSSRRGRPTASTSSSW